MTRATLNSHRDKSKRIQNKDVSTLHILERLENHMVSSFTDILSMIPLCVPRCVVQSKLDNLIRKGYITGCACGCRGDFKITLKGRGWATHLRLVRSRKIAHYIQSANPLSIVDDVKESVAKGQAGTADALLRIAIAQGLSVESMLQLLRLLEPLRPFLPNWTATLRYADALKEPSNECS